MQTRRQELTEREYGMLSEDESHNIVDSHTWGNYGDNASGIEFNYITGKSETWKSKNIYDLAGNIQEFTMEKNNSNEVMLRGGFSPAGGADYPVSYRYATSEGAGASDGFRVALYLK